MILSFQGTIRSYQSMIRLFHDTQQNFIIKKYFVSYFKGISNNSLYTSWLSIFISVFIIPITDNSLSWLHISPFFCNFAVKLGSYEN